MLARKPAHHSLAASRRRERTADAGGKQHQQSGVKSTCREHRHTTRADNQIAADQRSALTFDIDNPAGREHGQQRTAHDGGIEQADLRSREVQIGLQERRECRHALHDD